MSDANLNTVRAMYDAYRRRDAAAIAAIYAPHITLHQTALLPWGGRYQGLEGAMQFFGKLTGNIDSQVEIDHLIPADDRVVVVGRTRGTVKATGKPFDVAVIHVMTFEADKVTRIEFYIDTPAMLAALQA